MIAPIEWGVYKKAALFLNPRFSAWMNTAFHLDPLAKLKSYEDSTVAMMRAAQRRGHAISAIEPGNVFSRDGVVQGPLRLMCNSTRAQT
jgi:glutathione synthase/RimK-type ligase-like ATP-grasp enzyme